MGYGLDNDSSNDPSNTHNVTAAKKDGTIDRLTVFFGGDREQVVRYLSCIVIAVLIAIVLFVLLLWGNRNETALARAIGDLRYLSQQISVQATQAAISGDEKIIAELKNSQQLFDTDLQTVQDHYPDQTKVEQLSTQWKLADAAINTLIQHQATANALQSLGLQLKEAIPNIQADYNALVEQMILTGHSASEVAQTKHQLFLAERILGSMNVILSGTPAAIEAANELNADIASFARQLSAQIKTENANGEQRSTTPKAATLLHAIQTEFEQSLNTTTVQIVKNSKQILAVNQATAKITTTSDQLLSTLNSMLDSSKKGVAVIIPWALVITILFLGFSLIRLITLRNQSDQERVLNLQAEYDRNQNAILRLLDEIGDLADGDLRSYATVSEDFTGAIADSINFAIDQLRDLVTRIHTTSEEVSKYSLETQQLTMHLSEASEHNAQEIAGASAAINQMALSIDHVSLNATESAEVAKRSVDIAATGAEVVNRTIHGMDTIREQIQQTSKRIKRLGESSQEIGHIVSLINDIADQTNILALNAAIQASMAGEAGRGFAVVADEVQRLAERSAAATKQIELLVKTIQTDTHEAVSSMELTTTEVVRGTTLAKDAGIALDEIQSVSGALAELIQSISDTAREQSGTASHISSTMNLVQDITHQTTASTMDAARSVTELAHMAEALRESVTDFKLPDQV
jgi:twitching motility protein PilJ